MIRESERRPLSRTDGLRGDLQDLHGVRLDEFTVQKLVGQITDLPGLEELLTQNADADGLSLHDPVEGVVPEGEDFRAGSDGGHGIVDVHRLAKDRVVGMIPEAVAVLVFEQTERQRGLVVHQPCALLPVLLVHGEVQTDHIVKCERGRGNADIRSILRQQASGHVHSSTVDETVILTLTEATGQTTDEVIREDVTVIMQERVVQLQNRSQLMIIHRELGEVIDAIIGRNALTVRDPSGGVIGVLGKDAGAAVTGVNVGTDGTEQALPLKSLGELGVRRAGQDEATGRPASCFQKALAALLTAGVVPEGFRVFRLIGKIEGAIAGIHVVFLQKCDDFRVNTLFEYGFLRKRPRAVARRRRPQRL